jgi:multidrug efflux pump subunit AcrA (membrane-fusion protein)
LAELTQKVLKAAEEAARRAAEAGSLRVEVEKLQGLREAEGAERATLVEEAAWAKAEVQRERAKSRQAAVRAEEASTVKAVAEERTAELERSLNETSSRCFVLAGQVEDEAAARRADEARFREVQRVLEADLEAALGWRVEALNVQAEVRCCQEALAQGMGLLLMPPTGDGGEEAAVGQATDHAGEGEGGTVRKVPTLVTRRPIASPRHGSSSTRLPPSPEETAAAEDGAPSSAPLTSNEPPVGATLSPHIHLALSRMRRAEASVRSLTHSLHASM